MPFKSNIFIVPGLGNSGECHWQTIWQNKYAFTRIQQQSWDKPIRTDWIQQIDTVLNDYDYSNTILVGHSLACNTIVQWANVYRRSIKAALLVGPSDTEASSYPPGTTGFTPMPLYRLHFPSVVIASSNDFYVSTERALFFAEQWGSRFVNIGDAGHINVAAGFGEFEQGLAILQELDKLGSFQMFADLN